MDEDRREQLTRSAFMGALDDDNLIIHYIDKRVPERDSLASALEIAERYDDRLRGLAANGQHHFGKPDRLSGFRSVRAAE